MSLLSVFTDVFEPATKLVDNLHTSDDEKAKAKNILAEIKAKALIEALEYEKKLLDAQKTIITAEAQEKNWLQKTWRPITMHVFLILVVSDSFGFLSKPLVPEAWTLLQIGLGGYVGGRTIEKVAPHLKNLKKMFSSG